MSGKPTCPNCHLELKDVTKCACGWRARPKRTEAFEEDHWPEQCMYQGCLEPTAVAMCMAHHISTSTQKLMAPGQVFIRDSHGNTTYRVKEHMVFDGWVTRCSLHYLKEQVGRKNATPMLVHMVEGFRKFLDDYPEFKVKPKNDEEQRELQQVCMAKIKKGIKSMTALPYQPARRYGVGKKNLTAEQEQEMLDAIKVPEDLPPLMGEPGD